MELPYDNGQFDYIILADVIEHLHDPEETLARLIPYLKKDGSFLCSIPNMMHISVISPLLQGRFDYTDAGICDKTHLRFFTLDSILKLFQKHMTIEKMAGTFGPVSPEDEQMLDALEGIPNLAQKQEFQIYQYIFCAKKSSL